MDSYSRLHEHVSVSDTCWTPERVRLAGFRCPASVLFFFFVSSTRFWRGSNASDTPAVKKKKIPGYLSSFRSSSEFRCVSAVNLFRASIRWMSFFFFSWVFLVLTYLIFGVLDDHDSPNFSLQDHPSLLLPPFNRPDGSGGLSFLFLFSFQRATSRFLYILERQSPIF